MQESDFLLNTWFINTTIDVTAAETIICVIGGLI